MRTRETYFSAPITRCVMCRKRQLQALFWLGVEAALLFCVGFLLAWWLTSLLVPEAKAEMGKGKAEISREVRP